MSFYQPSLSLYDILSALSNETAQRARERGHDDYRQRRHPAAAAATATTGTGTGSHGPGGRHHATPGSQPSPGPQLGSSRSQRARHYHPRHPYARPEYSSSGPASSGASFPFYNRDPFNTFPGFFTPSTANGYFYSVPGQGYYYSPAHYWEDEDEDEEEEAKEDNEENESGREEGEAEQQPGVELEEENDEDMGTESAEMKTKTHRQPKERAEKVESKPQPSYYHSDRRSGRSAAADNYMDPFTELLTTLLGGFPSSYEQGRTERREGESEGEREENGKKAGGLNEGGEEEEEAKEGGEGVEKPETKSDETGTEEKEESETATAVPPEASPSPSPAPIPEPLQISKPETRLDLPFSPEVNVYDQPDLYVVVLALPGANSKAFKIDYHPSSHELLIKGNVIDKLGIDEKYLKFTEIKYGAFERTIKFPVLPRIKDEEIKATYSNGLLQIRVPKLELKEKPAPKKRITIEDVPDEELEFEENPNPVVE